MKSLLSISLAFAAVAGAQTTGQNQIRHVQTSLNHLTVLEFGEPVTTLAVADPDSFKVERHEDKVFVMPLREQVATNLFVWTASREISYELDPAGQLSAMDVLVRTQSSAGAYPPSGTPVVGAEAETRKIASQVLARTMLGVQDVLRDPNKAAAGRVQVELEQVYRTKDQLYIRYTVSNGTETPFRLTTPDVSNPLATDQPISLSSLRNHQLSAQTSGVFKAKPGSSLTFVQAETAKTDLAPGQRTTGIVSFRNVEGNPPQLFHFSFGTVQGEQITAEAVF